jgi:hypothetical protein
LKKGVLKTKDFFRGNLCNLGFFDSLNFVLHSPACPRADAAEPEKLRLGQAAVSMALDCAVGNRGAHTQTNWSGHEVDGREGLEEWTITR